MLRKTAELLGILRRPFLFSLQLEQMMVGGGIFCFKMLPVLFGTEPDTGQQLRILLCQVRLDFLPVYLGTMHQPGDFLLGEAACFQLLLQVHFQMIQEALFVAGGQQVPAAGAVLVLQNLILGGQGVLAL